MVLGGLGTGLAGASGLVGEAVGQNQTDERQLARDLVMGLEVSAPELAGVSGTIRAGGHAQHCRGFDRKRNHAALWRVEGD